MYPIHTKDVSTTHLVYTICKILYHLMVSNTKSCSEYMSCMYWIHTRCTHYISSSDDEINIIKMCSDYKSWYLVPSDDLTPTKNLMVLVTKTCTHYNSSTDDDNIIINVNISHIISWYWIPWPTCFDENEEILT